ncbi:hypothetical protein RYH80_15350 [Halobaculum sp. MBLA0147]|uniref:hypothetical protein n=1 Tax=Halobaculum sp. MBLA0147 TaxID=3079934 RepID=UPI0035253DE2
MGDALVEALNAEREVGLKSSARLQEIARADAAAMAEQSALVDRPDSTTPECDGAFQVQYQTWWEEQIDHPTGTKFYTTAAELAAGVVAALEQDERYAQLFGSGFQQVGAGAVRDDADRVWISVWVC